MIAYPAASREDREFLWRRDLAQLFGLLRKLIADDETERQAAKKTAA